MNEPLLPLHDDTDPMPTADTAAPATAASAVTPLRARARRAIRIVPCASSLGNRANRLKNDPTAIEEEARKNLGLIRPGETLVIVKDAPASK